MKVYLLAATLMFAWNCKKDEASAILDQSQKLEATELKTIVEIDDFSSAADEAIISVFQNNASGKSANSIDCYTTEFSQTGYTLSFDNCSLEEGGVVLDGSLSVVYTLGSDQSAFTVTYNSLSAGDLIINGTREFEINATTSGLSIDTVSDFELTLADDSVLEETGTKSIMISFPDSNSFIPELSMEGNWTVKADGNTYVMNVTSPLMTADNCDYLVSGVMTLNKNGLEITVDFGDGTCDDIVTVIYPDGTEEELSLSDL